MNSKLLAILAIFLVILSASAVSADDSTTVDNAATDDVAVDNQQTDVVEEDTESDVDADDDAVDEDNETEDDVSETLTIEAYDDGLNEEVTSGASSDSTSSLKDLDNNTTGNPVLMLLAACAILGGASLRRK